MTDLVVLVPSRGRPGAAHELVDSFFATDSGPDTVLRFICDADDPTVKDYPALVWLADSKGMVSALNEGARLALQEYPEAKALAFMGDDHRPVTPEWDRLYLEALDAMGGTGLVYGNDLLQGARIPTQGLLSANIVRTLGWFAPPTFKHLFVDDAWLAIGQSINRVTYLPEVIVEHLHPLGNKADWDEGYARVNAPEIASHDQAEFYRWKNVDLRQIRSKLLELL